MAGSLRSMQAGLAPLRQPAPAAAEREPGSIARTVKTDLDTAAEAVKREVSSCCELYFEVRTRWILCPQGRLQPCPLVFCRFQRWVSCGVAS